MSAPAPSIGDMVQQSIQVISKPSVQAFEQFENKGTVREAAIYVAVGAAISGVLSLFGSGISGLISSVITALLGFFVFTYAVHLIGKNQGGTGTFDQVAYSFALFMAPVSVLTNVIVLVLTVTIVGLLLVPAVGLLALALNVYFAYLAVQSSMNLTESGKIWITLIAAAVISFVVSLVIAGIFVRP